MKCKNDWIVKLWQTAIACSKIIIIMFAVCPMGLNVQNSMYCRSCVVLQFQDNTKFTVGVMRFTDDLTWDRDVQGFHYC